MKKKWSDKEVRYLTKAWTEGVSVKTIAEKLGRSITSVNVKACRMDLGRKSDPEDRITLNQLLLAFGLAQSITHFKAKFIKYKAPIVIKKAGVKGIAIIVTNSGKETLFIILIIFFSF